jgi:hypothetical protein
MHRLIRTLLLVVLLVAMAGLAACDDDDEEEDDGTTTPSTAPTSAPATPTASAEPFNGGQEPVLQEPPGGITTALLTGVFTQSFETYDQVTFEFQEGMPGFRIEYVEPPIIADASGLEVEIAGSAFLQVRMERAAGHDPDTGEETYTGSLELTPGIPQVVELERTGDFEGVLTWVLGVNERADFRVQTEDGPLRLVVEVAHPGTAGS